MPVGIGIVQLQMVLVERQETVHAILLLPGQDLDEGLHLCAMRKDLARLAPPLLLMFREFAGEAARAVMHEIGLDGPVAVKEINGEWKKV